MSSTTPGSEIVVNAYTFDIAGFFQYFFNLLTGGSGTSGFRHFLEVAWDVYSVIAIILSLIFFVGFVYAKIRYEQLHEIQDEELRMAEEAWARKHTHAGTKNARWDVIQARVDENNPASWRIAIIEADIFLEETLSEAGYVGLSLGEKLRSANATSFTTIQDAWEAHKVRNEIAHAGSDFVLTQKTARETILRFERVFREFGVI